MIFKALSQTTTNCGINILYIQLVVVSSYDSDMRETEGEIEISA